MTRPPRFAPGFRISPTDACALAAASYAAFALRRTFLPASLIIGATTFHFFLFCNVFRIRRAPEMIWAANFFLLAVVTIRFGIPGWPATIVAALAVAALLIALETRHPSYHGICWERLNPGLRAWWDSSTQGR